MARLRRSAVAGALLDGVNVASFALMAVVSWQLGKAALVDPLAAGLSIARPMALVFFRINGAVLGGAASWRP